MVLGS